MMEHHRTEVSGGRRSLLNGFMTAATRSWRHGLQSNGHASNAMVFPTMVPAVNTSPTSRIPALDHSAAISQEQSRRLQQQRHQDHRLNVLWYGGDDLQQQQQQQQPALLLESHNHRYQSTDEWEKQPLRLRRQKSSRKSRSRRIRTNKRPPLPNVPFPCAAILLTMYATAMASVYYVYGASSGSGWIWLRGMASNSVGFLWWLSHLSPKWYYVTHATCAAIVGGFWRWWCQQPQQQRRQRWCCYALIVLFYAALFPSLPLAEVFGGGGRIASTTVVPPLENSTIGPQHEKPSHYYPSGLDDDRLTLYEGLWQVVFLIFVAYCLILPPGVDGKSDDRNDENINNNRFYNKSSHYITTAVVLFTTMVSFGFISLNVYTAYRWYFLHVDYRRDNNNFITSKTAIQQVCYLSLDFFSFGLIFNIFLVCQTAYSQHGGIGIHQFGWLAIASVYGPGSCRNQKSCGWWQG